MHQNTQFNTISTDITDDLHFMILEVKQIAVLVRRCVTQVDTSLVSNLQNHEDYVENLKSRIESLAYDAIFKLKSKDKGLIAHYKALVRVTGNIQKSCDFLVQAARQIMYVKDAKFFSELDLHPFFDVIEQALERIHKGFTEVDSKIAQHLVECEQTLDELYLKYFNFVQDKITSKSKSSDMITLLFIVRYFERIGDRFLSIGESILNISIGDALHIKHYQRIEEAVQFLSKKKEKTTYEFKPFLFSRSGCKVGRLILERESKKGLFKERFFYKQGDTKKIVEEIEGLEAWHKKFPGNVPDIAWSAVDKEESTLIVNYLPGENFLNFLLGNTKAGEVEKASIAITKKLEQIWGNSISKERSGSNLIKQILTRRSAIEKVHEDFFDEFTIGKKKTKVNFAKILKRANQLEKKLVMPFSVWCHGDFNLDNILYDPSKFRVSFVDVHRSGQKDYAQEVSVFIVSALRIKLENPVVRKKLYKVCREIFDFSKQFAKKHGDDYFEARFAFGLFRSFITSTRFVQDDEWYNKMRKNALLIMDCIEDHKKNFKKLDFDLEKILR